MKAFYTSAAAVLLLSACADTVPVDDFEPDRSVAELDQINSGPSLGPSPAQTEVAQSDGAALNLSAVTTGDFGASIEPGRSCTFTSAAGELLLVAAAPLGVTSRPRAVVRLTSGIQRLDAMRDGGYNYLIEGPAFQNRDGLTITIVREDTPSAPVAVPAAGPVDSDAETDQPAQSWPATMTAITEGAEQEYPQGIYTCGV